MGHYAGSSETLGDMPQQLCVGSKNLLYCSFSYSSLFSTRSVITQQAPSVFRLFPKEVMEY